MANIMAPRNGIPIGLANVAGRQVLVDVHPEYLRFFQTLIDRVGGVTGSSTEDLTLSQFEDAGIEEQKHALFKLADDLWQLPPMVDEGGRLERLSDDLLQGPPPVDFVPSIYGLALLSQVNIYTNVQAVTPYRANISGSVTIDLAAAKSNNLHLTLTGNVSSFALTNPVDGGIYSIRFIQDATGGRSMPTLPSSIKFSGGTAPTFTTTANAVDFLSLQYGGTEASYMGSFLPDMS